MARIHLTCGILVLCFHQYFCQTAPSLTGNQDQAPVISQLNVKLEQLHARIADQDVKIAQLETKVTQQNCESEPKETKVPNEYGVIFTRWGRRDCPRDISETVYSGITGGSWYDSPGGAAEYECLPRDPTWGVNKHFSGNKYPKEMPHIYGAEYEDMPNSNLNRYTAPCVVCRALNYSTSIMIPGRERCYSGWREAYHGDLGSGSEIHKGANQYICIDSRPQATGTSVNDNGKIIHLVKAKCGSLPCPPYEDNKILTCVVCLK